MCRDVFCGCALRGPVVGRTSARVVLSPVLSPGLALGTLPLYSLRGLPYSRRGGRCGESQSSQLGAGLSDTEVGGRKRRWSELGSVTVVGVPRSRKFGVCFLSVLLSKNVTERRELTRGAGTAGGDFRPRARSARAAPCSLLQIAKEPPPSTAAPPAPRRSPTGPAPRPAQGVGGPHPAGGGKKISCPDAYRLAAYRARCPGATRRVS